ncbi:nitroreductase family protein [Bradyrhizobium tropiciagri]|uniref:nitroreductase family protein n=1 Tax=Bradyrhizobium tropiciagri TaxID=312253 RepID=UPI000A9A0DB6|nr:nitroreductase family protein [Bradyrhizobium tropiciagri]
MSNTRSKAASTVVPGPSGIDDAASAALHSRYGKDLPLIGDGWNGVLDNLLAHRSVRAYRPDPVPRGTVETLVAAAQSASSSSNLQTWSVVAVEDEARKARLAEFAGGQKHIVEAPLFLVWLADLSRAERLARSANHPKDGLPFLETFIVAVVDAALAAQNAVLAAEALGLGSVYIGALRNRPQAVAEELRLPPQAAAVFGLCIGYPDPTRPARVKPRLRQDVVIHRERYATAGEEAGIAAYDATLRDFQNAEGLPATGWTQTVLNRLGSVRSLNGRDRLVEELRGLGFPLK